MIMNYRNTYNTTRLIIKVRGLFLDDLVKSKEYPIGTVRTWNGIKYRKEADGKWRPVEKSHQIVTKKKDEISAKNFFKNYELSDKNPILDLEKTLEKKKGSITSSFRNAVDSHVISEKIATSISTAIKFHDKIGISIKIGDVTFLPFHDALASTNGYILKIGREMKRTEHELYDCVQKEYVNKEKLETIKILEDKIKEATLEGDDEEIDKIRYKIKSLKALLEEFNEYERFNVVVKDHEYDSTIMHEIGHMIETQNLKILFNIDFNNNNHNDLLKIYEKAKNEGDIKKISYYANTNEHEFFAEAYTMYHFERDKLPKYIINYFDEVLKYDV